MVDTVTGQVVYQVQHKRASGPVHLVLSEHWLIVCLAAFLFHLVFVVFLPDYLLALVIFTLVGTRPVRGPDFGAPLIVLPILHLCETCSQLNLGHSHSGTL